MEGPKCGKGVPQSRSLNLVPVVSFYFPYLTLKPPMWYSLSRRRRMGQVLEDETSFGHKYSCELEGTSLQVLSFLTPEGVCRSWVTDDVLPRGQLGSLLPRGQLGSLLRRGGRRETDVGVPSTTLSVGRLVGGLFTPPYGQITRNFGAKSTSDNTSLPIPEVQDFQPTQQWYHTW